MTFPELPENPRGQPLVRLDEAGREMLRKIRASDVLLSLAHTRQHATAVAILVR